MTEMLFSEYKFGGYTLRNRIVCPPLTTSMGTEDGKTTEDLVKFYARRAKSVGLMIVEPGVVSPVAKITPWSAGAWEDSQIPGMSLLAEAIKNSGAVAILQLCHAGPKARSRTSGQQPIAPSDIQFYFNEPVKVMSLADIAQVRQQFVDAAIRAKKAGFTGVELHAAHFYLLSAFLSPVLNNRTDEYGIDIQGRTRIVSEIVELIKEQNGPEFLVLCRINGFEYAENGIKPEEAAEIGVLLEKSGADALHISANGSPQPQTAKHFLVPATPIPTSNHPRAPFIDYAEVVKRKVSIPVIAVSRLDDFELAEGTLQSGKADLIAIGRGLIADPDWTQKVQTGSKLVRCIACCDCLSSIPKGAMICRVNKNILD